MIDRFCCVTLRENYGESYPRKWKIHEMFKPFGRIHIIISHPSLVTYFFVAFKCRSGVDSCLENRQFLYREFGLIVEEADMQELNQDGAMESNEYGGPENPEVPSLMNLNNDCLLHILSYLKDEESVSYVCRRLRRLCRQNWRILTQLSLTMDFTRLDRIFHCGQLLTHLTISDYSHKFHKLLSLMLKRCSKLKYLSLVRCNLSEESMEALLSVKSSLRELTLRECFAIEHEIDSTLAYCPRKLEKLKYSHCFHVHDGMSLIPTLSWRVRHLNTLIMPHVEFEVNDILYHLPNLKVLACSLNEFYYAGRKYPKQHGLEQLYCNMEYLRNGQSKLLEIRKVCQNLRHLRVDGQPMGEEFFLDTIAKCLPLDGLYLCKVDMDDSESEDIFEEFAEHLKFFILEECEVPNDFTDRLISWHPSFEDLSSEFFLNQTSTAPLTIIGCRRNIGLSSIKTAQSLENVFGKFSIYSFPSIS